MTQDEVNTSRDRDWSSLRTKKKKKKKKAGKIELIRRGEPVVPKETLQHIRNFNVSGLNLTDDF